MLRYAACMSRDDEPLRYVLFDTPIGQCGLAWSARGIRRLCLPEASEAALRSRLHDEVGAMPHEGELPEHVRAAIDKLAKQLRGEACDVTSIPLDLQGVSPFTQRVYRALQQIPPGWTTTYGELARMAGSPRAAQAVGRAMATNPLPLLVPCHRVLGGAGKLGGFTAHGGTETKAKLLKLEGALLLS